MPVEPPLPDLATVVQLLGEAGSRVAEIDASKGAAGNISVVLRWPVPDVPDLFPYDDPFTLPLDDEAVPELAGATVVVTGSGRRLREVERNPRGNLAVIRIGPDGRNARIWTARQKLFTRPTSELNSHLAIHRREIARTGTNFHAVVHAQPLHITYLSHVARYQDTLALNRAILRWQPESIHSLPDGVGFVPFEVPGSDEQMRATLAAMERHRVALWAKHGLIVRSDVSVKRAVDLIEYAEVGARYEYLNLTCGDIAEGLTPEEIRRHCEGNRIEQSIF